MKLSLITSSLIAVGVAIPVLQGTTQPADLRSPVLVTKRVSEPAVEAPGLEERAVPATRVSFANFRAGGRPIPKRDEVEAVDESDLEERAVPATRVSFANFRAGGRPIPKRDEVEAVDESDLEERAVPATRVSFANFRAGGRPIPKREEVEAVDESDLEERAVPATRVSFANFRAGGRPIPKREEVEVVDESESALEARGQGNFHGNHNFNHQQVKDSQGGRFQGGQFPGGQVRASQFPGGQSNPSNLNGGSQTANVQVDGGEFIQVTMGQPEIVNGPVNSLSTDKGSCMAASRNSNVNFSVGRPTDAIANGNRLGPIIAEREFFVWCFDPSVLEN